MTRPAPTPLGPLFDERPGNRAPLARTSDPLSSHAAADRVVRSGKARGDAVRCLVALAEYPGVTAETIARVTGIEPYTVRKRLADLRRRKQARSTGKSGTDVLRWWPEPSGLEFVRRLNA